MTKTEPFKIKWIGEPPINEKAYFDKLNPMISSACKCQELLTSDELDLLERDISYGKY